VAMGRYKEAGPMFERALSSVQRAYGPSDLHVAQVLESYAAFLRKTKRAGEAQRMDEAAQTIRKMRQEKPRPAASTPH
jgi:hypothetical protein